TASGPPASKRILRVTNQKSVLEKVLLFTDEPPSQFLTKIFSNNAKYFLQYANLSKKWEISSFRLTFSPGDSDFCLRYRAFSRVLEYPHPPLFVAWLTVASRFLSELNRIN